MTTKKTTTKKKIPAAFAKRAAAAKAMTPAERAAWAEKMRKARAAAAKKRGGSFKAKAKAAKAPPASAKKNPPKPAAKEPRKIHPVSAERASKMTTEQIDAAIKQIEKAHHLTRAEYDAAFLPLLRENDIRSGRPPRANPPSRKTPTRAAKAAAYVKRKVAAKKNPPRARALEALSITLSRDGASWNIHAAVREFRSYDTTIAGHERMSRQAVLRSVTEWLDGIGITYPKNITLPGRWGIIGDVGWQWPTA